MPFPLDILHFVVDALGSFADTLRDPEQRKALIENVALAMLVVAPASFMSISLGRYAKKRGRTTAGALKHSKQDAPFEEPRLNEAFDAVRRNYFKVLLVGSLPVFTLASFLNDNVAFFVTFGYVWNVMASPRIFVETCMAFGAELAPVAESAAVTPVSGS